MQSDNPEFPTVEIEIIVHETTISIKPDKAVARIGQLVRWNVMADPELKRPLSIKIYFSHGSPFRWSMERNLPPVFRKTTTTVQDEPEESGEYKYGVKSLDESGKEVADDDPFLIILPTMF